MQRLRRLGSIHHRRWTSAGAAAMQVGSVTRLECTDRTVDEEGKAESVPVDAEEVVVEPEEGARAAEGAGRVIELFMSR